MTTTAPARRRGAADGVEGVVDTLGITGLRRLSGGLWTSGQPDATQLRAARESRGNRVDALFALESYFVRGRPAEESMARGRAAGLTGLESAVRGLIHPTGDSP